MAKKSKGPKLRGRKGKQLLKHKRQVAGFRMSADGQRAVSADWFGDVYLWNIWDKTPLLHLEGAHVDRAQQADFLAEETRIVSGGFDSAVRVWDIASGDCVQEQSWGGARRVWEIHVSHDDRWLLTTSILTANGYALWPIEDGQIRFDQRILYPHYAGLVDAGPEPQVWQIQSQDDASILTFHRCGEKAPCGTLAFPGMASTPAFSGDGTCLAIPLRITKNNQSHKSIAVYSIPDGTLLHQIEQDPHAAEWDNLSLSHDGALIGGTQGSLVRLWDARTGKQWLPEDSFHTDYTSGTAFACGDTTLVSSGWDRTLRCWDLQQSLVDIQAQSEADLPATQESTQEKVPDVTTKMPSFSIPCEYDFAPDMGDATTDTTDDPDELFAQGYYQQALARYKRTKLPWRDKEADARKAYRYLDQAMCLEQRGDENGAHDARWKVSGRLHTCYSGFNQYAWALYKRGLHDKALWVVSYALRYAEQSNYLHTINTYLSILDALGRREALLPQLACHRAEAPDFDDSKELFEKYQDDIDALWARSFTDEEKGWAMRYLQRNQFDWECSGRLATQLVPRDPGLWDRLIVQIIDEMTTSYSPALENQLISCIHNQATLLGLVVKRMSRWLDNRVQYDSFKPVLKELVRDFLLHDKSPKQFAEKLRKSSSKRPYENDFVRQFVMYMDVDEALYHKLVYLGASIDRWGMVNALLYREVDEVIQEFRGWFSDGHALLLELAGICMGRDREDYGEDDFSQAIFTTLVGEDLALVLKAIPTCSAQAQPGLLDAIWAHDPDASIPLLLSLAAKGGKTTQRLVVQKLSDTQDGADHALPLLDHKKQSARQVGVEVLIAHGRDEDKEPLLALLKTEKAASIKKLLEAWQRQATR